jgi:methylated-DNA-[protein]-cysteine S-methyltransferase
MTTMTIATDVTIYTANLQSPIGELRVAVDERGALLRIDFPGGHAAERRAARGNERPDARRCARVLAQLREYFAGTRTEFELELAPTGTEFQLQAWRALQRIPFGRTASYQQQAVRLGKPRAMRAVGAANGRNPIPIVVPCHRVIGKDGSLTGFGGGLDTKRWLLEHEARVLAERAGTSR